MDEEFDVMSDVQYYRLNGRLNSSVQKRRFEEEDQDSYSYAEDVDEAEEVGKVEEDEEVEEVEENESSDESEDENHIEIDYPDEEDDVEDNDLNMDDGEMIEDTAFNDSNGGANDSNGGANEYFSNLTNIFRELNKSVQCDVCNETLIVFKYSMDRLDQSVDQSPTEKSNLLNPCGIHHTCVKCIKTALMQNTVGILKDGQGNFPCLGDMDCKMHDQHRTTTFLYQLRELFTDAEWGPISRVSKSLRTVDDYHSFLVPLTPKQNITFEMCVKHAKHILSQDGVLCVQCPVCQVPIEKTTACFAMRHCDWEICWMCGKIERRLDQSHWSKNEGDCKCPRYDSHPFWQKHAYMCIEGKCYTEERSCDRNLHEKGRETMNELRKRQHLSSFIKSLPEDLQTKLSEWINIHRHSTNMVINPSTNTVINPSTSIVVDPSTNTVINPSTSIIVDPNINIILDLHPNPNPNPNPNPKTNKTEY